MKIILASTSPRRKEFLDMLEIPYEAIAPEVDELSIRDPNPEKLAMLLAEAKAEAIAKNYSEGIIVGSDTVIEFEDQIIEKPLNEADQRRLIYLQKGKSSIIISAVCFINVGNGEKIIKTEKSYFQMADIDNDLIEQYINTGQGLGKGGGFGIQDENGLFIKRLDGCYPNSIGFPICLVADTLRDLGLEIKVSIRDVVKEKTGKLC